MNKLQQYIATWLNLTNTLFNKRTQTQKSCVVLVIQSSKTGRTTLWCLRSGGLDWLYFLIFCILNVGETASSSTNSWRWQMAP